ncbi:rhodanese-like domain-containing protein [Candidatus Venteria ishoeyi]|uniref:rhodanese-like domain-containing protein n=1 Tax=Candidatus Venteria ishoeyi TaxID=1899563 RepID=UPI0025A56F55|nr:rhodanese-like domain-containing protein [Candidatus Venteria ishoeyi]MDM8547177.1 rhodanese-like domain-containing protein [Candidatus Venteria ishoeyi]
MMHKILSIFYCLALLLPLNSSFAREVNITADLPSIIVKHQGKTVIIERSQDTMNSIMPDFALTSRPCPPLCIQPMQLATGVETVAELEVLDYLQRWHQGDDTILVVDSRVANQFKRSTIPGTLNIPWTALSGSANPMEISEILSNRFNVVEMEGLYDFSQAKTLVMFCNGAWCGQSPNNIKVLLKYGYPAHKIKWYRGGMQDWESFGLTTVSGK